MTEKKTKNITNRMPTRKRQSVVHPSPPSRISRHIRAFSLGIGIVVVLGLTTSVAYSFSLRGKVYPGVQLGLQDLGGLTYAQAEKRVTDTLATYADEPVRFQTGSQEYTQRLSDLGISFDVEASLEAVRGAGRTLGWLDALISPVYAIGGTNEILPTLVIQPGQIELSLAQLASEQNEPARLPSFSIRNGQVEMSRGQAGQRLDTEAIEAELLSQANALRPKNISLAYVSDPTLDDQATKDELLRKAASRLESPVLLKSGDQEFSFAPEVLAKWLTVQNEDEEWSLALNADVALADLKAQLASLEQKPTPMQTYQALESVDPIQAGEDGRAVDYVATMDRLQKQWLGSGKKSFDVATKVIQRPVEFLSVTAPHAEGKSILTDLSRQTTFAFKDGQLQFFSLASTGKYPMPTPTGEFKIYNKTRRQVMDGPGYYLPNVQWVMFYNGDYSLHGTYWHNNFGHPMSHGCSNLSNASAERFYNFADVGTPVTIIGETPRK